LILLLTQSIIHIRNSLKLQVTICQITWQLHIVLSVLNKFFYRSVFVSRCNTIADDDTKHVCISTAAGIIRNWSYGNALIWLLFWCFIYTLVIGWIWHEIVVRTEFSWCPTLHDGWLAIRITTTLGITNRWKITGTLIWVISLYL